MYRIGEQRWKREDEEVRGTKRRTREEKVLIGENDWRRIRKE